MLIVENYKMFAGVCEIVPLNDNPPYTVRGVWLYRPDTDTWYANGSSYPAECVVVKEDLT